MQPLFSVIVPIYNAEKYLNKCLNSILFQTNEDFEVVMVDDGSTDSSSIVAQSYAAKDPRFIYIRQINMGTSGATNTCLEHARGKYLINLDNDDYVAPTLLEDALKIIVDYDPDIIQYQSIFVDENDNKNSEQSFYDRLIIFEGNENLYRCEKTMPGAFARTHSRKVFRRSVINSNRFRGPAKGADTSFLRRVLLRCEKIVFSPDHMFFVRELNTSESRKPDAPYFYKEWLTRELEDVEECAALAPSLNRMYPLWEFSDFIDYFQMFAAKAIRDGEYDADFYKNLNLRIRKNSKYIFANSIKNQIRWRVWLSLTKLLASRLAKRISPNNLIV